MREWSRLTWYSDGMSLFIQRNETRTKLQERIEAELREKAMRQQELSDRPDGVSDSRYLENTKATSNPVWLWVLIAIVICVVIVWLFVTLT